MCFMESPENGVINVNETQKKTEVEYFSIIAADRNVFEELKKGMCTFSRLSIVLSNIFTFTRQIPGFTTA